MSREGVDWEHDHDPNDYADAHITLEHRGYDVVGDRRYAYCRRCGHVICGCDEEAPESLRNYHPVPSRDRGDGA
jgi:hypothetical protein